MAIVRANSHSTLETDPQSSPAELPKVQPSQMFKKELNKRKMLFQMEAKPVDLTALLDSIKSHKNHLT